MQRNYIFVFLVSIVNKRILHRELTLKYANLFLGNNRLTPPLQHFFTLLKNCGHCIYIYNLGTYSQFVDIDINNFWTLMSTF